MPVYSDSVLANATRSTGELFGTSASTSAIPTRMRIVPPAWRSAYSI
jgi:hypothetical protein